MSEISPVENKKIIEDDYMSETTKRSYTLYTDQEKIRFFRFKIGKCVSASAAWPTDGYSCSHSPEMGKTI
jgi:hypothetical protein